MPDVPNWPHYELPSTELAAWVDQQPDMWWMVDGDPLLTGRLSFPCPSDELAADLRELNRPLLIRAKSPDATGQPVGRDKIDSLASQFYENIHTDGREHPPWASDRLLDLWWKDRPGGWLLAEDSAEATRAKAEWAEVRAARPPAAR